MIKVPPIGPKKCRLALVGEAPGEVEELNLKPFDGPAGDVLNRKLSRLDILRSECYITNLSKYRPKSWYAEHGGKPPKDDNDFSIFWEGSTTSKHPSSALEGFKSELLTELEEIDTNVFVAMGANALWALTGESMIGKYRGTIMQATLPSGRLIKVIPTWHPAASFHDPLMATIIEMDLAKAKEQAEFPEVKLPDRIIHIKPSYSEVVEFLDRWDAPGVAEEVAFDIETAPSGMTCISLAFSPKEVMSIPTTIGYWGSTSLLKTVLERINISLQRPHLIKVAQNAPFDIQYLARFYGILPAKPWADTMLMHHVCYAEMRKGLDFLSSIYTNEPYYKDDLKLWREDQTDLERLWTYNAKDSAVTLECYYALKEELTTNNTWGPYNYLMELMEPLIFMMLRGRVINWEALKEVRASEIKSLEESLIALKEQFGDINPNSPKQVKEFMKGAGIPIPIFKGKETTNKKLLKKLYPAHPELEMVVETKEYRKTIGTYLGIGFDANDQPYDRPDYVDPIDKRFRFSLTAAGGKANQIPGKPEPVKGGTKSGRLSSSRSIFYTGNNIQNWMKRIRHIVVPDPGYTFVSLDLAGAEARVVAYCCSDQYLIDLFNRGDNIHKFTARELWGVTDHELEKDREEWKKKGRPRDSMYDRAKIIRHGGNYKMSWVNMKEELRCSAAEAKAHLARFYGISPTLSLWHDEVKAELSRSRSIVTPLGWKRIFFGHFNDAMLREAIATIPQETVVRIINEGITKAYNTICTEHHGVEVAMQVHDEIVFQVKDELVDWFIPQLPSLMDRPITIKGETFTIPIEVSAGKNWGEMEEIDVPRT